MPYRSINFSCDTLQCQQEEWCKVITREGQGLTPAGHHAPINVVIDDQRFIYINKLCTWFNIRLAGIFCTTPNAECTVCLEIPPLMFACGKLSFVGKGPNTIECCPLQHIKAIGEQTWMKLTTSKQCIGRSANCRCSQADIAPLIPKDHPLKAWGNLSQGLSCLDSIVNEKNSGTFVQTVIYCKLSNGFLIQAQNWIQLHVVYVP